MSNYADNEDTLAVVDPSQSVKNIEELYNTTRVNQEKRLNKISKQLEVLNVTIREITSSKKPSTTPTGIDKVFSSYHCVTTLGLIFRGSLLWRKSLIISQRY